MSTLGMEGETMYPEEAVRASERNHHAAWTTWKTRAISDLVVGDLVRLANPPYARVASVRHLKTEAGVALLEVQLDARSWSGDSGSTNGMFVICRYPFEAIDVWRGDSREDEK